MTIQQLTYFKEIAATRNYTQAAANLYIAQPTISHSIQKLEDELNVPLFIRNPNKTIELTSFGKAFLPYAEKVLNTLQQGTEEIEQLRNPYSGIVKIAGAFGSSMSVFQHLLENFRESEHSDGISLRPVVIHEPENFSSCLPSGEVDLLVAVNVSGPEIQSQPLAYERLMVYLPNSNPLSRKESLKLADLREEIFLTPGVNSTLYKWIMDMFQSDGLTPQLSTMDAENRNWASLLTTIACEQKVCIFPSLPVSFNNITAVPLDHPMNKRLISIAWATNRALSPAVRYVRQWCIDFCKEHYKI